MDFLNSYDWRHGLSQRAIDDKNSLPLEAIE